MLQKAVELYNTGLMLTEIAKEINVPYTRVQNLFKKNHILKYKRYLFLKNELYKRYGLISYKDFEGRTTGEINTIMAQHRKK